MPKSRNLPMTTREPIRCKSKRVFITKLELGLSPIPTKQLQGGALSSGLHCLYRVFSHEKFKKRESLDLIGHLLVKGQVLSSDWFSFPGLATDADWFPFPRLDSYFPGLAKGSDWFSGGGVRSGDFQRLFSRNLTKWSSLDSSIMLLRHPQSLPKNHGIF